MQTPALDARLTSPLFEQYRRAIEGATVLRLAELLKAAYGEMGLGHLTWDDLGELEALAAVIRARPAAPAEPAKRSSVGSRPRSAASLRRRRKLTREAWCTDDVAEAFTMGEQAVAGVIAIEQAAHGCCRLFKGRIAAFAGVCRETVRKVLRALEAMGCITTRHDRRSYWRSEANVVTVVCPEWLRWIARRVAKRKRREGAEKNAAYKARRTEWDRVKAARRARLNAKGKAWAAEQVQRDGSDTTSFVAPTSESFLRKESPSVASQPQEENCPSGSSISEGGFFAAARRAALKLGLDPSHFGIGPEDSFKGVTIEGVTFSWT